MVEKFKQLLKKITDAKGPVWMFAIMKMDELTDKWSIILSAPWATLENKHEAFNYIFELLSEYFTDEEKNSIARIGLLNKNEHLIELLLQYKKDAVIENQKVNGNMVHEAYILESNSTLEKPSKV